MPDAGRPPSSRAVGRVSRVGAAWLLLLAAACSPEPPQPPAPPTAPMAGTPAPTGPAADASHASRPDGAPAARDRDARGGEARVARQDVDLRRDERRGGHTIARHVGRTDAQLKARLARESIAAASTYPDLETAERIVAVTLAENDRRVRRWMGKRGPRSNLAIRYRARDGLPTGRIMHRGDDASVDASGAVVVLRWRDGGYYVLTSYPEHSR